MCSFYSRQSRPDNAAALVRHARSVVERGPHRPAKGIERITLELLKGKLVEVARGDQVTLLEECFTNLPVLSNGPVLQIVERRPLKRPPRRDFQNSVLGGLQDGIRVAVDVNELCVRESLQQEPDAARVRRRLEHERPSVFESQFANEPSQGSLPLR
jgi:hypothetical protein